MPRPRTSSFWRQQVGQLSEENPGAGAPKIEKILWEIAAKTGRDDVPSTRQVGRLLKDHRGQEARVRAQYGRVRWPETMEAGLLPWEAGPAVLEFQRVFKERPTLRFARWFWRVSVLAPDARPEPRAMVARYLALAELLDEGGGREAVLRWAEGWLIFTPWRSPDHAKSYQEALATDDSLHLTIHTEGITSETEGEFLSLAVWRPSEERKS